jgi:DNA polymerase-3 subunit alpha
MKRAYSPAMNRKSLESLIKSGALDELGERKALLANVETLLNFGKGQHQAACNGQSDLFGHTKSSYCPRLQLTPTPPVDKKEKLAWEKELLGLYVSDHPLQEYKDVLRRHTTPIDLLQPSLVGKRVRLGGIVTSVRVIATKQKQPMAFVKIEDLTRSLEIIVFPSIYSETLGLWKEDQPILLTGKVNDRDGDLKILVDSAQPLNHNFDSNQLNSIGLTRIKAPETGTSPPSVSRHDTETLIFIKIPPRCHPDIFQKIKQALQQADKGLHQVALLLPKNDARYEKLETNFFVKKDDVLRTRIEKVLGPGSVSK